MLDIIGTAVENYHKKWDELVAERSNRSFFDGLKPVALGWKVADAEEYKKSYEELREHCDRIVETWMNGRWIAKMHLKEARLSGGIEIVKLMQRRPESTDKPGLDHLDFYSLEVAGAEDILSAEDNLKWTHESNDVIDHYGWISIWFAGTEAKLKSNTVIDIVMMELEEINRRITRSSGKRHISGLTNSG